QPFLHLWATGVDLDEAGQFRQSRDLAVLARDIADVGDTVEGNEVVFAGGVQVDIADEDEFFVADVEGDVEDFRRVAVESGEDLLIGPGSSARSLEQTLPVGVFADGDEDLTHGSGDALLVDLVLLPRGGGAETGGALFDIGHQSLFPLSSFV